MCDREMTLEEWVYRLPKCHLARKQYEELKLELMRIKHLEWVIDLRDEQLEEIKAWYGEV